MKQWAFLFFCWLGIILPASAQQNQQDVLYLQDGSIIRGKILENTDESVRIRITGGSEFVFKQSEIDSLNQEKPGAYASKKYKKPYHYRPTETLYGTYTLGMLFSSYASLLYFKSTKLSYGGGVGFRPFYNFSASNGAIFAPVYAEYRGESGDQSKPTNFEWFAQAGYGFPIAKLGQTTKTTGGVYANIGCGMKVYTRTKVQWHFGLGYQFQRSYMEYNTWIWQPNGGNGEAPVQQTIFYNRLTLLMGWSFGA